MALVNQEKTSVEEKKEYENNEEIRYRIRPTRYINYDCSENSWEIEFHLPGVSKEKIDLRFLKNAYSLKAQRDQALYHSSEYLPFEIDESSINAEYNNGLLYIKGKIKDPLSDAVEIKLN